MLSTSDHVNYDNDVETWHKITAVRESSFWRISRNFWKTKCSLLEVNDGPQAPANLTSDRGYIYQENIAFLQNSVGGGSRENVIICMMTSLHYNYQNALRQAIVFSIFSFVKNRSCVTQFYITEIAAKCILVIVVKWRHHTNYALPI